MAKANAKGKEPPADDTPEDLKPNDIAKTHVDRDLRWPRSIRDQLPLVPGERWKFSIVGVSKTEFTVKAEKV